MNDRAVNVLEKYDIEVLRSWKGRSAILCETKSGIKILKEYRGSEKRLLFQQKLLRAIVENGYPSVEEILFTKEGGVLVRDEDMTAYYLKSYHEGKECNSKDIRDCERSLEQLAGLHKAGSLPMLAEEENILPFSLKEEFQKHNRELKKVRRFLKDKGQKTDFELVLSRYYEFFYEKARRVTEEGNQEKQDGGAAGRCIFCHGDFQHHNILLAGDKSFLINFEKHILDCPSRDISLFFRKIMEKNNWSEKMGERLLGAYEKHRRLSQAEKLDLYYRLSYPEKFWKIVNFYYNSNKAWIPGRNLEKLEKLLRQEEEKNRYLNQSFFQWVLH